MASRAGDGVPTVDGAMHGSGWERTARAAYLRDTGAVVRRRLHLTIPLFLLLIGVSVGIEHVYHPQRTRVVTEVYAFEWVACLAALGACRLPWLRTWPRTIAAALAAVLSGLVTLYIGRVDGRLALLATAQVCLLNGLAVLLPWGWASQLLVAFSAGASFAFLVPAMGQPEEVSYACLALLSGAITSVCGALFLERHRYDAAVRTAQLTAVLEKERRHRHLLSTIDHVQSRFIAETETAALFDELLEHLLALTGSEYGFVGEVLRRPDGRPYLKTHALTNVARDAAAHAFSDRHAPDLELDDPATLLGAVITNGARVIANDAATDPRAGGLPPGHPPLRAFLGIPFHQGRELVGMAGLANRPGGYDDALLAHLQPLLATYSHILGAHRNARRRQQAEEALRAEAGITAALARAGRELIVSLEVPVILERLCRLTADVLACDVSATLRWDPQEDAYVPVATVGMSPAEEARYGGIKIPRELVSAVAAPTGQDEVVELDGLDPNVLAAIGVRPGAMPPLLLMALRLGGEVIGVQAACRRDRTAGFTVEQRRIAGGLARIASLALANGRLLDDLKRANQLKSEFVSTMSHELRTPLNVILGYAEMAQDPKAGEEGHRVCLPRIEEAGRELLALIESTLEIGRIEAGRDQARHEPVALAPWWADLREACARMPRRGGVRLDWGAPPDGTVVVTDPRKLTIVVRNLVGNALKFTERGCVLADLAVDDGTVVLRVADTGIGIRPEDQRAIFEMFRQADGSDSRRYGGAGLGLYIVRRFVDQLGGTVTVESVPAAGAAFTVRLPSGVDTGGRAQ